ncbi:MAG: trifunctional serine/threonine-protein kinase/ATP-binding protein/sensor histidine kinase [Reichenbachiella sp.]
MKEQLLYESKSSKVFLTDDKGLKNKVITKILNEEYPSPEVINKFYNEFDLTHKLSIEGVRQSFERRKVNNRHAIVLQYVPGKTIRERLDGGVFSIADFLKHAIEIARILSEVHDAKIIHKDINSHNLIIDNESGKAHLLDFGISTKLNLKKQNLENPERLEGSLMYISPEQTGRMNRMVDYRTDLYSLGITFYEMLTGKVPFQHTDAMEMVHAHIASQPASISSHRENIPKVLQQILDKLMSKNAEDRYQSARGLMKDLDQCLEIWNETGDIQDFELCQHDFSGDFLLPQKLYGRENELSLLMDAFSRVAEGELETVLVGGYSGTGKSVLVHETHGPITAKRGYFIEGKFDQFQRSKPYLAFVQAFTSFVSILLTEKENRLEPLREQIKNAVGNEGKVLTDLIPNLEMLIGAQPSIPKLGGLESQNRLNYLFSSFIKTISTADHPVVFFIDDLQWADSASLSLLNALMSDKELSHLMCVCAYRDNEVSPDHPFMITVEDIREKGGKISEINIGNLEKINVQQLISDATDLAIDSTISLSDLVFEKTHGNAFFITQFIKNLVDESLLYFDQKERKWKWDIQQINERNITDNVVELLSGKIVFLPEETQEFLKIAACIGNKFDVETLKASHEENSDSKTIDEEIDLAIEVLQSALAEGYITPIAHEFRFTHDRIQQAVYSLIPEKDKSTFHYRIGSLLWKKASVEQLESQLFEIVNQLNQGLELIDSEEEKESIADLNLRAGLKARDSSAFQPSFKYFETGIGLLKPNHWESQYDLSLGLFTEAAESAYNMGEFEPMEEKLKAVLDNKKELMDVVRPYAIRINALKAQNKLQEAIDTGLEVLDQLGEKFPKKGPLPLVMVDLVRTKIKLMGKDHDHILGMSEMTDPYKAAALRILNDIASPVYWARPAILPFIIFRMVRISLKYGVTEISAFGFATYGLLMCGVLGDMSGGYRFGQIGLALLDRFEAKRWLSQIYTPIYALINHWSEHVHKSLDPFLYSYKVGFETGAIEYACINANIYCNHIYLGGKPLAKSEKEMRLFSEQMLRYKQKTNYNYNEIYRQAALNLLDRSKDPTVLSGEAYDEVEMAPIHESEKDRAATFLIHNNNLMLNYLFHDYDKALEHAKLTRPLLDAVLAKYDVAIFWFYEGLVSLAVAREASGKQRRLLISRAKNNISQFRKWAKFNPVNHQHKLDLLIAEYASLKGSNDKARKHFDLAIKGAESGEFLNEEALSLERAGIYYLSTDQDFIAENYLRKSYQTYKEWGAIAKMHDLKERFPKILIGFEKDDSINTTKTSKGSSNYTDSSSLDLESLMKAAQAISGEVVLEQLLKTLLNISMENAGAESGCILLKVGDHWFIRSSKFANSEFQSGNIKIPLLENKRVPESLVQYIQNTNQSLVLDDISKDSRFMSDSAVKENKLKSVLCLPMLNKGNQEGILYLENNLQESVFTENRVRFLELLSGQIAVSMENAHLYENLENRIEERTSELKKSLKNLKSTQEQLRIEHDKLDVANKTKNKFFYIISHDLRGPMTNFMGLTEWINSHIIETYDTKNDKQLDEITGYLKNSANQVASLLDNLLNWALQEEGIIPFNPALLNVKECLDETISLMTSQAQSKFITLPMNCDESIEAYLDKNSFMTILRNLAGNAIKFTPENGTVSFSAWVEGKELVLTVSDTGIGIEKNKISEIFELRDDKVRWGTSGEKGTGLGLKLVHDFMKANGGSIMIESEVGKGTIFKMNFPLR